MKGSYGEFIEHYYLFENPLSKNFRSTALSGGRCFNFTPESIKAVACKAVVDIKNTYVVNRYLVSVNCELCNLIVQVRPNNGDHDCGRLGNITHLRGIPAVVLYHCHLHNHRLHR